MLEHSITLNITTNRILLPTKRQHNVVNIFSYSNNSDYKFGDMKRFDRFKINIQKVRTAGL